jgi:hypothetical protein
VTGAIVVTLAGLFLAGYGGMMRFATRGQKVLSGYASTGLQVARIIIPIGAAIAGVGVVGILLAAVSR